jgi:hypothetical protein
VRVSLTSIISDDDHPVALWLRATLRRSSALRSSYLSELPHRLVHHAVAPGRSVVRWDVLGTAIDLRIRCAFTGQRPAASAAAGVAMARWIGAEHLAWVGAELLGEFDGFLGREQPQRRDRWLLDSDAERRLDQLCFSLAWFDRLYRDGRIGAGSPLAAQGLDLDGLLDSVPDYAIQDLQKQVLIAERALGSLRASMDAGQCVAGPSFAGSGDVGGADADLLVGTRLVEIKSTGKPHVLTDQMILQLAGYLLLDYRDEYRIGELGFYLTRIGWLKLWPVDEFLHLLGARQSVHRLREDFARATAVR